MPVRLLVVADTHLPMRAKVLPPEVLAELDACDGVVRHVSDQEILDAKAKIGAGGLGCEPASAASVAGARALRREGVIAPGDRVVCILTGHQLKDPTATVAYHGGDPDLFESVLGSRGVRRASFANAPVLVPNDLDAIVAALGDLAPEHAAAFAANAERYGARVDALRAELVDDLAAVPPDQRVLVTCEGAFSYLAADVGLDEVYLWPVNAEQQSTPRQVAAVIDEVRDRPQKFFAHEFHVMRMISAIYW